VDVDVLVIPARPGTEEASVLLRHALDDICLATTLFTVRIIETDDAARARRFDGLRRSW